MFGFHWEELLVVAFIALIIFGPKRLPEIGGAMGKTLNAFKKSINEVTDSAKADPPPPAQPAELKAPPLAANIIDSTSTTTSDATPRV